MKSKTLGSKAGATIANEQESVDVDRRRVLRSHSETSAHSLPHGGSTSDRFSAFHSSGAASIADDPDDADFDPSLNRGSI